MKKIFYRKVFQFYKYKLIETYSHQIAWLEDFKDGEVSGGWVKIKNNKLILKEKYAWDGPSGPTIDTKSFMRGSLVHDALYQLIESGLLPMNVRKKSDKEMRKINLEDGMNKFRAWYTYIAVRLFARNYARSKKIKRLSAP